MADTLDEPLRLKVSSPVWLVTGGAGFIGSHLAAALLARGDGVVVLDNAESGSLGNIAGICGEPGFLFLRGSVLDAALVDRVVGQVDVVAHLAAAVGVRKVLAEPLATLSGNLHGTENVVEAAARHRRRLVVASSSEIYGKNPRMPVREDDDVVLGPPTMQRWVYALGKATDEALVYAYHRERGLDATVVRLFNTVGPRQSGQYGMVMPRLAAQALTGRPLTVHGTGRQTRCFCHVADVVDGIIRLAEQPAATGRPFNVGSNEEVSIADLADRIRARAGSSAPISYTPYPSAGPGSFEDTPRRVPDTSALRELTGWAPRRSLDDTIGDVIDAMRVTIQGGAQDTSLGEGPARRIGGLK